MKRQTKKLFSRETGQLIMLSGLAVISMIAYNNCSGFNSSSKNGVSASSVTGAAQLQMGLQVKDASGNVVYDDSLPNQTLTLKAGQAYSVIVSSESSLTNGASLTLKLTDISSIGAVPQVLSLVFGTNVIPANLLQQGDYSLEFDANVGSTVLVKSYSAAVSCPNPTFTAASLDPNGISVASAATNNLFDFNVAGVTSHADGMAPYQCALDPTGTSIKDTGFQPCSQLFSKVYDNYVGARKVGVIVKDACNIARTVTKTLNLAYSEPALGAANVFIFGQTSNATGAAATDSRVNNVTYLATNQDPHNIVTSAYDNKGAFTIQSSQNYQLASSVNFGVTIALTGLSGSVNPATMTGSVDASQAKISSVAYSTDESGGSQVALSFSGASCVLSNQQAAVKPVQGPPCTTAGGGTQNGVKVEVWGHYKCQALSNSSSTVDIEGDFDGIDFKQDSCIGGGGGGGGGIIKIGL